MSSRDLASRGPGEAVNAFLTAVVNRDIGGARDVLRSEPRVATTSLHVASVLGLDAEVRRLIALDASQVNARVGEPSADPLLWLCYSPFHGESPERDEGLAAAARALLDAGANANTRDGHYGVPALHAVTGVTDAPRIARLLLEAGAQPTDGESVFHAAELDPADVRLLPEAASEGRFQVVSACLGAGFPVDTADESGATALHHAAIRGCAEMVRELLDRGADLHVHDREHAATPLGWACFGADNFADAGGDWEETVRALLAAGARPSPDDHNVRHRGVREVLRKYAAGQG